MKPSLIKGLLAAAACLLITNSCEKPPVELGNKGFDFGSGVFIVNEGQFLSANASVSFFNPAGDSVHNHIFYRANQVPLGDIAHSMFIWEDDAYIVVNNSGKIYRTGRYDMAYRGKITGLSSPRYITIERRGQENLKAYVSDLYSGYVMVLDPLEGTVLDSIQISRTGERYSSEQMILHDGRLYVACWSYGRHILVIDTSTDQLVDSIEVGIQPNSMVLDKHGSLWVLSDGGYPLSSMAQEPASLARINLENYRAETMKIWDDIMQSPSDLCINTAGNTLYFISGGVYRVSLEMEGFSEPLIPAAGRQFYSLGIHPDDGSIYVGDAVDYQQNGWVYRYHPDGSPIDSFRVGVNPGFFCFTPSTQRL